MDINNLFMTDAQLQSEVERCEFCEEKPCRDACPAHCSPADFIMAARGGTREAIRRSAGLIMAQNPLGGVCGGVCPDTHCQRACAHRTFDTAVEIPRVQAAIVARAKVLGVMPVLDRPAPNGKKVAVLGGGPAGLAAASVAAGRGYAVTLFEKSDKLGGAAALIPDIRLPQSVLQTDIAWALEQCRVDVRLGTAVEDPASLLSQGFDAVVVAAGLGVPFRLDIPGAELALSWDQYLANPAAYKARGRVAVIGGGAVACDVACVAKGNGASQVELFTLETLSELPMTPRERQHLLDFGIEVSGRVRVTGLRKGRGRTLAMDTVKVVLPKALRFHPANMKDVFGSRARRSGFDFIIMAIGAKSAVTRVENPAVLYAGDCANGPTTVVEAVAAGKNAAALVDQLLCSAAAPVIPKPVKSYLAIPGLRKLPRPIEADFFGRTIPSPFLLSAAPPSDGYDPMRKAYEAGWAGGIMKTAFNNVPIHIPAEYMHVFDPETFGNCDNVSGHSLDRVCSEIERLNREFPDRLTGGSTGGPLSGNDEFDAAGWVANMKKLESAGAGVVEFSLSCPQGGDGTEGDIVSQNARLTAKIIDWLMRDSRPEIPKLFKLTAAVTSIQVILQAVKAVLDRYPGKKAGVTLANTFPTLYFKPGARKEWDEGILVGMSGTGVAPISNLTLASVSRSGVYVSGNGGAMDARSAAHFLALGAGTVQFCTAPMKYGVGIVEHLHSGLSHLMDERGIPSVAKLIGAALPKPITDFMALSPVKGISSPNHELCQHCGNCTRCGYLAITLNPDRLPVVDPEKCIGCSLCVQKCFAGALAMRARTPKELEVLSEA
jgi:NADPH-dependent glutamate synthase beta subunit-like oxidoreductase/dihydroorotate dehydrogenase/Pyruvate/2-oxoacid:ferredoxin oxidoreductase delta subunit